MEDIVKNLTVFRKSCKTVCIRPSPTPPGSAPDCMTSYTSKNVGELQSPPPPGSVVPDDLSPSEIILINAMTELHESNRKCWIENSMC